MNRRDHDSIGKKDGRFSSSNSKQLRLAFALHIASLFAFSKTSPLAGFAQMQTTQCQKKGSEGDA